MLITQPLAEYGLDLVNCDKCNNTGQIVWYDENRILRCRDCECMNRRKALRRLYRSNLAELQGLYTFKNFKTPTPEETNVKNAALLFCKSPPAWFYIYGIPGSGKTHICTAAFFQFIKNGVDSVYCKWREDIGEIKTMKAAKDPPERLTEMMEKYKTVPLLYIDDFLKGKITDADINIAFEILNARYNNPSRRTIISSELDLAKIPDKAISGRIRERAKGYIIHAPNTDRRTNE